MTIMRYIWTKIIFYHYFKINCSLRNSNDKWDNHVISPLLYTSPSDVTCVTFLSLLSRLNQNYFLSLFLNQLFTSKVKWQMRQLCNITSTHHLTILSLFVTFCHFLSLCVTFVTFCHFSPLFITLLSLFFNQLFTLKFKIQMRQSCDITSIHHLSKVTKVTKKWQKVTSHVTLLSVIPVSHCPTFEL